MHNRNVHNRFIEDIYTETYNFYLNTFRKSHTMKKKLLNLQFSDHLLDPYSGSATESGNFFGWLKTIKIYLKIERFSQCGKWNAPYTLGVIFGP